MNQFYEWHEYYFSEKEHILEDSCKEGMIEVSDPSCELIEHVSPASFELMIGSCICSLPFPPPKLSLIRLINYYMVFDPYFDFDLKNFLMEKLNENVHELDWSLRTGSSYNSSIGTYYKYLEDKPRRIILPTLHHHFADFSKVFDKLKRTLQAVTIMISVFSYPPAFEVHS